MKVNFLSSSSISDLSSCRHKAGGKELCSSDRPLLGICVYSNCLFIRAVVLSKEIFFILLRAMLLSCTDSIIARVSVTRLKGSGYFRQQKLRRSAVEKSYAPFQTEECFLPVMALGKQAVKLSVDSLKV